MLLGGIVIQAQTSLTVKSDTLRGSSTEQGSSRFLGWNVMARQRAERKQSEKFINRFLKYCLINAQRSFKVSVLRSERYENAMVTSVSNRFGIYEHHVGIRGTTWIWLVLTGFCRLCIYRCNSENVVFDSQALEFHGITPDSIVDMEMTGCYFECNRSLAGRLAPEEDSGWSSTIPVSNFTGHWNRQWNEFHGVLQNLFVYLPINVFIISLFCLHPLLTILR